MPKTRAKPIRTDEKSLTHAFNYLKEKLTTPLSDEECEAWKTEFLQRPGAEKTSTDLVESAPESVRKRFPKLNKFFLRFIFFHFMY